MTDKVIFFLSSQSWAIPSDWNNAANTIEVIDGGSGGAQASNTGGQGGGYRKYTNRTLSGSQTVTVGAGGGANTAGGTSSFGSLASPNASFTGGTGGTDFSLGFGGAAAYPSGNGANASSTGPGAGGNFTWTSTHNPSGGASVATASNGSGADGNASNQAGGAYGGGGAVYNDGDGFVGTVGGPGLVVVTYTPIPPATGTLAATEAKDTLAASGQVFTPVSGTLAATEAKDTLAAAGGVGSAGSLAATDPADTFAANGTVANTGPSGALAATDAKDTLAAAGFVGAPGITPVPTGGPRDFVNPWKLQRDRHRKQRQAETPAVEHVEPTAEEIRQAKFAKDRAARVERLRGELAKDKAREEQRKLIEAAKLARQAEELRKAEAAKIAAAIDPAAVARERRRQRQVAANHAHAADLHRQAVELAGHFVHHLVTTPRKK